MRESDIFESVPGIVSGALVFKDTRIPVDVLFENLAGGSSLDEILEDFPTIGRERAEAAIRLAASRLRAAA
ncbi:DUF433 domain-containing protein [Jiella endophytica]|uniref:DUF433 domain-containing protein n=1 Tax=Jiella endophytica TaxID=2558362 RepID=A0A4Y8RS21_9HYPH|nr:DUF433 domain-containing protein [Jiella endophytica]TFF27119.1 DUF433 domain-containing protein [Jiella endophytica]